jgi:hypothetical protein
MNSRSPVRRSHAALFAVIPAHGSGEASMRLTFVVSPSLKSATLPTTRQTTGTFPTRGPRVKPTSGTASAPHPAPSPTQTRARKRRRSGDTAGASAGSMARSSLSCVTRDLSDPVEERMKEQGATGKAHHVRADEAPRDERHAEREQRGPGGRRRRRRGRASGPPAGNRACGAAFFAHEAPCTLTCGAP